jgi:hypothetical protein
MPKVKQSEEVAESLTRREKAMTDLFVAVMNGYDECPPYVKEVWQRANKESKRVSASSEGERNRSLTGGCNAMLVSAIRR